MATSSSAKKVAKLASRGKGKKVRFQGGTLFPVAVALVVVLGLAGIVYARQTLPSAGSGAPRANIDHWHAAYGILVCDTWQPALTGTKEEQGTDSNGQKVFTNTKFADTGIHSHGDNVIHYHPYTSRSAGSRAKLGVFLDVYDVKISDNALELPTDQGGEKWSTDTTKCNGQAVQMKVRVWPHFDHPDTFTDYVTNFANIRLRNDGMVFAIAFVPKNANIPIVPQAAELPTLGAKDSNTGAPTTTVVGQNSVPGATTVGSDTATSTTAADTSTPPSGSTPATAVSATTVPATTGG